MGAWGYGSDENDTTYDLLGIGIMERSCGVTLGNESKKSIASELEARGALNSVGVVVWLVKVGAVVPVAALEATIRALETEYSEAGGWFADSDKRMQEIQTEMALLKRTIEAGGQIDATGARGILEKM